MEKRQLTALIVPTDVLVKTLEYLGTRPFNEVAALINDLQQKAKPVEEEVVGEAE